MVASNDKDLKKAFLQHLCKIKNWSYHSKIEITNSEEIREFLSSYLFPNNKRAILYEKQSSKCLQFLTEHHFFKHQLKALVSLMSYSSSEQEFISRYKKVTLTSHITNRVFAEEINDCPLLR